MARSIWRSTNSCPDLKAGMVIKYSLNGLSGYYLVTYRPNVIVVLKSNITPVAGLAHLGPPITKSGILEIWSTLHDFLMDNGVEVLVAPTNF